MTQDLNSPTIDTGVWTWVTLEYSHECQHYTRVKHESPLEGSPCSYSPGPGIEAQLDWTSGWGKPYIPQKVSRTSFHCLSSVLFQLCPPACLPDCLPACLPGCLPAQPHIIMFITVHCIPPLGVRASLLPTFAYCRSEPETDSSGQQRPLIGTHGQMPYFWDASPSTSSLKKAS